MEKSPSVPLPGVVGGERSDIWIGDGGGEEEGLFAQPAAEDLVVIYQAHIFYLVVTWVAKFRQKTRFTWNPKF